jgi:hypothetical protein
MNNNTPTTEEVESEKVLNQEVSNLKSDLDNLGDKLDKGEVSLDEFQAEADSTLAKHTFKDFMEFFSNSYRKLRLTMENPEAYLAKPKVFIGKEGKSGKARRRAAKTEEIKIRAALRLTANVLEAFDLKKLANAYVAENCVALRKDTEAIEEAKKWFNSILGKDLTNVNCADALNSLKMANHDLLDTIGNHVLLAVKALAKTEGSYDVAPLCLQLTKNANAVAASIAAARSMTKEELEKVDFEALEVFSNSLKDFNSVVEFHIKEADVI